MQYVMEDMWDELYSTLTISKFVTKNQEGVVFCNLWDNQSSLNVNSLDLKEITSF